jgi:Tfp pilus assembly protein PilN
VKRFLQFSVLAFVVVCVLIFAAALAGGLTDETAFTPEAKGAAHR